MAAGHLAEIEAQRLSSSYRPALRRLDYRSAYRLVAEEVLGDRLSFAPDLLASMDPTSVMATRTVVGGAAPERAREHAASVRSSAATAGMVPPTSGHRRRSRGTSGRDRSPPRRPVTSGGSRAQTGVRRSEEHTSELQSREN